MSADTASPAPFLAIDFGTSKSAMAVWQPERGKARVIRNEEREETTPSVVYLGPDETLVGTRALEMLDDPNKQQWVIPSVKRDLVDDAPILLPDGREIEPVEVAAAVFRKLREDAISRYFKGQEITRAVVTCPAGFDTPQQDAIAEAVQRAGFTQAELVEEPVAAAITYVQEGFETGSHVLVYDLGGGTFDLAVLAPTENDLFRRTLRAKGIVMCGGDDFDQALYEYLDTELGGRLSREGKRNLRVLRRCRLIKELLSDRTEVEESLLLDGERITQCVTRATFEGLIRERVEDTVQLTEQMVVEAEAAGQSIETVVLIGGSSEIPLIRKRLAQVLPVQPEQFDLQSLAVVLGAAYYGARQVRWKDRAGTEKATRKTGTARRKSSSEQPKKAASSRPRRNLSPKQQYKAAIAERWVGLPGVWRTGLAAELAEQVRALGLTSSEAAEIEHEVFRSTKERMEYSWLLRSARQEAENANSLTAEQINRLSGLARGLGLSAEEQEHEERTWLGQPLRYMVALFKPAGSFTIGNVARGSGRPIVFQRFALSPDGQYLALKSGNVIELVRPQAGGDVTYFSEGSDSGRQASAQNIPCDASFAFTPDSAYLVHRVFSEIWLEDVATGKTRAKLKHALGGTALWMQAYAACIAFRDFDELLAGTVSRLPIGGWRAPMRIHRWSLRTRREAVFAETQFSARRLAVSANGTVVASGGNVGGGGVEIWDGETGQRLRALPGYGFEILALSPDGGLLVTQGLADAQARETSGDPGILWNVKSGDQTFTFPLTVQAVTSHLKAAAFSPDGTLLATMHRIRRTSIGNSEHHVLEVHVWDAGTFELRQSLPYRRILLPGEAQVGHLAFFADGKSLLAIDDQGNGEIWRRND